MGEGERVNPSPSHGQKVCMTWAAVQTGKDVRNFWPEVSTSWPRPAWPAVLACRAQPEAMAGSAIQQ